MSKAEPPKPATPASPEVPPPIEPTRAQESRARWLQSIIDAALSDRYHPAWETIDRLWWQTVTGETLRERVTTCLSLLRAETRGRLGSISKQCCDQEYDWAVERHCVPEPNDPDDPVPAVLWSLRNHEPAFETLRPSQARAILMNAKGPAASVSMLVRLALACGAFDLSPVAGHPTQKQVDTIRNRWKPFLSRKP